MPNDSGLPHLPTGSPRREAAWTIGLKRWLSCPHTKVVAGEIPSGGPSDLEIAWLGRYSEALPFALSVVSTSVDKGVWKAPLANESASALVVPMLD